MWATIVMVALSVSLSHAGGWGVLGVEGWEQLSPAQRSKAESKYEIYRKMPPSRQQEVRRNYEKWRTMRPAEKERIRRNYDLYRDLTPEQRRDVGRRYQDEGADR